MAGLMASQTLEHLFKFKILMDNKLSKAESCNFRVLYRYSQHLKCFSWYDIKVSYTTVIVENLNN